jgi:lipopolysaccharide export system protein LptA
MRSFPPCDASLTRAVGLPGIRRALVAVLGLLLVTGFQELRAQDLGTDCELREYASIRSTQSAPGLRVTWLADPFLVCPDGTRIRSDSAVVYEQSRRAELIGGVRFETEARLLESRLADYFEREGRLFARGDVVFTDLERGSEVRGDTLTYLGVTERRSEEQVTVTGGRPEAILEPPTDRVGPDGAPAPYRVIGNRLRFEGERFFWADGDVEVFREDLEAYSDSLAFDQGDGQLFLNGNARVLAEAEMEGDQINLAIPDDVLERVTIRRRGRLLTEDLELVGEEIRVTLEDEKLQRVVAVHRSGSDEDPPPRPRAVTADFTLQADSIDVLSPDEILETVHAVGRARGETLTRGQAPLPVEAEEDLGPTEADEILEQLEALGAEPPQEPDAQEATEDASDRPQIQVDRDWIEGNEILAVFEPVIEPSEIAAGAQDEPGQDPDADEPEPEVDPESALSDPPSDPDEDARRPQYRLVRLEAKGNARTLYRSPPEEDGTEGGDRSERPGTGGPLWAVSYIVAEEIAIFLVEGEVERLEARDTVLGIQLEPDRDGRGEEDLESGDERGDSPEGQPEA